MIRFNVMNWKIVAICKTAYLASVGIAQPGGAALSIPVRSAITTMAAEPSRIIFAAPIFRRPPFCKTFTATKIVIGFLIGLLLEFLTASKAGYSNPLSSLSYSVCFLPFAITSKTAKMILCHFCVIWFPLYLFSALCTSFSYHNHIIPRMEN